jgi:hypothetical protein
MCGSDIEAIGRNNHAVTVESRQIGELSRIEPDAEQGVQRRRGPTVESAERHRANEATTGERAKRLCAKPALERQPDASSGEASREPATADVHDVDDSAPATATPPAHFAADGSRDAPSATLTAGYLRIAFTSAAVTGSL